MTGWAALTIASAGLVAAPPEVAAPAAPDPAASAPPTASSRPSKRKERRATFDVSALARFAAFVGDTRQLTQPLGYGFAMSLNVYPWQVGRRGARAWDRAGEGPRGHLGFFGFGGHARAPELLRLPSADDPLGPRSPRWQRVGHTDFAIGLAGRTDLGRVFLGAQLGGGLAISEFLRPTEARVGGDQRYEGFDPLLRGSTQLGVGLRGSHGLVFGLALTKVFSGERVPLDVDGDPDAGDPSARPFDFLAEFNFGYHARF